MNKRTLGIAGIFLIGIALGIVINSFFPVLNSGSLASSQLEKLYELVNPNIDVSVVKADQVSGMYKVLFKAVDATGTTNYREAYITQDGNLLTESMIVVGQSISQLTKIHGFVDCLAGKNVRIAGIANNTETLLQFNALGGSYATKLYLSCDGEEALKCVQAGITQVPTVIYEDNGYPGVKSIQSLENLTACKF